MKTIPLLLALICPLAFGAETPADPHAAHGTAPGGKACCTPLATAPFSANSVYQADAPFTTDEGRAFTLGELRGQPVVLAMFFTSCGYACPLIVTAMQDIRARLPDSVRDEAVFVLVSFDLKRDQPAALAEYRVQRRLDGAWRLLHGSDDSVRELAALLGVRYKQTLDGAFSHSNVITLLNRQGEIVHQRAGLEGGLDEAAAALAAVVK